MKSIFSALILLHLIIFNLPSELYARDIVLIENLATVSEGNLLKNILIKKFKLPAKIISLKNNNSKCEVHSEAIVHLCLLKNGELEIRKMNQYVVKNSLGIFLDETNEVRP